MGNPCIENLPLPPPTQPLPMYQMAYPVTVYRALGAYTRRSELVPCYSIPEGLSREAQRIG